MLRRLARLAVLALVSLTACQLAAPEAADEGIRVLGTGRVTLTPDRATFTAGVNTLAPTAAQAVEENSRVMTAVVEALKKAGTSDAELRTSQISLYPEMAYEEGRGPRVSGYRAMNNVTVTRSELDSLSKLLQVAVDAGANQVSGVSFVVSDPKRGRDEGLQAALADAQAKAQVLAQAAGRSLGKVIAISEVGADTPQPLMERAMSAADKAVPVEPGTQELIFSVSVAYALQ
jgi:uncharacterized protein YggE